MNDWQYYRKRGIAEMRPYVVGESLEGISVSPQDTPAEGDMIARDPANPKDQWLVTASFFKKNYELTFQS